METSIFAENTMKINYFGLGGQSGFQRGGALNFSVELSGPAWAWAQLGRSLGPAWAPLGPAWAQLGPGLGPAWARLGPGLARVTALSRHIAQNPNKNKNENLQNANPFCPNCRQDLD